MTRHRLAVALLLLCGILAAGACSSEQPSATQAPPPAPSGPPYGTIQKVEKAADWKAAGSPDRTEPIPAGFQLWVVSFDPNGPEIHPAYRVDTNEAHERIVVLDDTGQEHRPVQLQYNLTDNKTSQMKSIVYLLPEGRQPRSLRFAAGPIVTLP